MSENGLEMMESVNNKHISISYFLLLLYIVGGFIVAKAINAQEIIDENTRDIVEYRVSKIYYDIDGLVLVSALQEKVGLQEDISFSSLFAFQKYLEEKRSVLTSYSVFTRTLTTITYVYYWNQADSEYNIEMTVYATPIGSLIVLPYPRYSSDSGFALALRLRDYNFLGTLDTLSINFDWNILIDSSDQLDSSLSTSFSLPYSWSFGKHNLGLNIGEALSYNIQDAKFTTETRVGLGYSYPLAQRVSYGASTSIKERSDFEDVVRDFHSLQFDLTPISLGFLLTRIPLPYIGNINYGVSLSYSQTIPLFSNYYKRDSADKIPNDKTFALFSGINGVPDIDDPHRTRLNASFGPGHSISLGSISNVEGTYFRQGFQASLSNSWSYNIRDGLESDRYEYTTLNPLEGWSTNFTLNTRYHTFLWDMIGINMRGRAVQNLYFRSPYANLTGNGDNFAGDLRGVTNDTGFNRVWRGAYLNSDIMVKLGQIVLTKILSAEIHMGPLMDLAIRAQPATAFNIDDDFQMTLGIQGVAYNLNYAIRFVGWYGVDIQKLLSDARNDIHSEIAGIWYSKEIYIGTALFY